MSGKSIKRTTLALALIAAALLLQPIAAQAAYGIESFDVQQAATAPAPGDEADLAASGGAYHEAGGHPYSIVTHIEWNNHPESGTGLALPDGDIKDTYVDLPAGLVGNPSAFPRCTPLQLTGDMTERGLLGFSTQCPMDSQVGVFHLHYSGNRAGDPVLPLFNMTAPTGQAARFGFNAAGTLIYFDGSTSAANGYRITVGTHDAQQALRVYGADVAFWGIPADPRHNGERCEAGALVLTGSASHASCPLGPGDPDGPHSAGMQPVPLLTLPTSCPPEGQGEEWPLRTNSWQEPGVIVHAAVNSHLAPFAPDPSAPGQQQGTTGCDVVPFSPDFSASPTQQSASSPTGLNVHLSFPQDGLLNPDGIAQSHLKKAVVTLPEGVSINPSQGEGLEACTPEQFKAASVDSFGCPSTAKVGTVEVKTPLLEETVPGNVYIAQPYENPFNSLLAIYVVLREPQRGISIGLPGKVEPNLETGQLVATFDDLPQLPVESFDLSFREGARAPLVTPQACGTYTTEADFYPWARPEEAVPVSSSFEVTSGIGGSPCPSGGLPPFKPGLIAGTLNNAAGSYSPFNVRLFRSDEEQEITHFSIKLPPGVIGKIAGLGYCSDAAIDAAKLKTGAEELANPSCPASSYVGRTLAGAGVGTVQTYAPGKIYYAGPYHGSAISIAAITAAKVGPFDLGTVVIRQALDVNPETGEIFIDATGSDPIPHIIDGITTHIRDIRAYVDRSEFVLNPTSCERTSTASTVLGSGLDFASEADDEPVTVSTPFQAADCAALPFRPKLNLSLLGGTKRGDHPRLRSVLRMRQGEANIARAEITLPRSEFLENAHIKTICTRVQFKAGEVPGEACPPGSVYGFAKAFSPILDYPLEGPLFLRSSEHQLPDLVAALHSSAIDINVVGRVISTSGGGIRTLFETVPDAPVSKFILTMQGGKKGLLVNSTNLCRGTHRAVVKFDGHNGKISDFAPKVQARCGKHRHRHRHQAKPSPAPTAPATPYRALAP